MNQGMVCPIVLVTSLLSLLCPGIQGYGTGAPDTVCGSQTPAHGLQPSTPSPYQLLVNTTAVKPGGTVTVSVQGKPYQGIIVHARAVGTTTVVGVFTVVGRDTKLMKCSADADTVTHLATTTKNETTIFTWKAPNVVLKVEFVATVAQEKDVWWTKIKSPVVDIRPLSALQCFQCNLDLAGPPRDNCSDTSKLKPSDCGMNDTACYTVRMLHPVHKNFSHFVRGCYPPPKMNETMKNSTTMNSTMCPHNKTYSMHNMTNGSMFEHEGMWNQMNRVMCDLKNHTCKFVCNSTGCNAKPPPPLQCLVCDGSKDPNSCRNGMNKTLVKDCPPEAVGCASTVFTNMQGYSYHIRECAKPEMINASMPFSNNKGCQEDKNGLRKCFGFCGSDGCNHDNATSKVPMSTLHSNCTKNEDCKGENEMCWIMPNRTGSRCVCKCGYIPDVMFNCMSMNKTNMTLHMMGKNSTEGPTKSILDGSMTKDRDATTQAYNVMRGETTAAPVKTELPPPPPPNVVMACDGAANPCGPIHKCTNDGTSHVCTCVDTKKWRLSADRKECINVNECENPALHNCDDPPKAECLDRTPSNSEGVGFTCMCKSGYTGAGTKDTCIAGSRFEPVEGLTKLMTSVSPVMQLPDSFPVHCGFVKEFWISENGQIWMASAKDGNRSTDTYDTIGKLPNGKFSENLWQSDAELLIAPYMTMLQCDKSSPGKGVSYKVLSDRNYIDAMTLQNLERKLIVPIRAALVVNWDGCMAFGNVNMTTKFQAIVASDYNNTFVVFKYEDSKMRMNYQMSSAEVNYPVRIGVFCKPSMPGKAVNVQEYIYSGARKDQPEAIMGLERPDQRTLQGAAPSSANLDQLGVHMINASNNNPATFKNPSIECGRWLMKAPNVTERMLKSSQKCPSSRALIRAGIWNNVAGENSIVYDCFERVLPTPDGVNFMKVWMVMRCCYMSAQGDKSGVFSAPAQAAKDTLPINTLLLVAQRMEPTPGDISAAVEMTKTAFRYCCVEEPAMCDRFMSKVPVTNARQAPQPNGCQGNGDPHWTTLDGAGYTFNPYGEFDAFNAKKPNDQNSSAVDTFILQVFTRPRNSSEKATAFYKVAAQQQIMDNNDNMSSSIIEFSYENGNIVVYIDKKNVTDLSTAKPKFAAVVMKNGQHVMAFPMYGISIEATVAAEMMSFTLILADKVPSMTYTGLLGNNDGNTTNDLLTRSGMPPKSTSHSDIYDMGLTWCVDQGKGSLFFEAAKLACKSRNEFLPIFADSLDWTNRNREEQEAIKVCGSNQACLYDAYVTGQVTAAMATLNQSAIFTSEQQVRVNRAPLWAMPVVVINVTKDVNFTFELNATDPDKNLLTYSLAKSPPVGVMKLTSNTLTWTDFGDLEGKNITMLQVMASDGYTSVPLSVRVQYCKCHKTQGTCIWESIKEDFAIAKCNCNPGYAPPYCVVKDDPCSSKPCFPGVSCNVTDPATLQQNASAPLYTCGSCPPGYTGDGKTCTDIDECSAQNNCDRTNGVCRNTAGSYVCGCKTGYVMDSKGACVDVDECKTSQPCDVATSVCNNTVGGYNCTCNKGYEMSNGQCQDIDECRTGKNNCDNDTTTCSNIQGSFACNCKTGFRKVNEQDPSCVQINECLRANCSQNCTDKTNAYECTCNPGYVIVPDQPWNCRAAEGAACTAAEIQSSCLNGTCAKLNNAVQCTCKSTEKLVNNICVDRNECAEQIDACKKTTSTCVDKVPGYECQCNSGYKKDTDGFTCIDIDECQTGSNNCDKTNGICTNTGGSFVCSCKTGWELEASNACTDVNECTQANKGGCDATYGVCTNAPGNHSCSCKSGFSGDGYTCSDVNECTTSNGGCNQRCSNTIGSRTCSCLTGYVLAADGKTCDDVNECTSNQHNCKGNDYCNNTQGGFKCTCPPGEALHTDGYTCLSIQQCNAGHGCQYACNKASDGTETCVCQAGYKVAADKKTCADDDECASKGAQLCPAANNVVCVNTVGSYVCNCSNSTYYQKESDNKCIDKDECLQNGICPDVSKCQNKAMGYECVCPAGYEPTLNSLQKCTDVDECADSALNKCVASSKATCVNTTPGYHCQCPTGYKLNADTYSCSDVDECTPSPNAPPPCGSEGTKCSNTAGSFSCDCLSGYSAINATHCQNINECQSQHGCQQVCVDIPGSYRCECQPGYTVNADGKTCSAGTACTANHGCGQLCAVVGGANKCSCYNNSYSLGSDSKTCNDVNECAANNPCKGNSTCVNKTPGFGCECTNGFKLSPDGVSCINRDGGWSDYSSWGSCDKSCGGGRQNRTRTCTNPTVVGDGIACAGSAIEYGNCNENICPLTPVELIFGVEAKYLTSMTIDQYMVIKKSVEKLVADSTNSFCRSNASLCCNGEKYVKSPMPPNAGFTTDSHLKYCRNSPFRNTTHLTLCFLMTADKVNGICNSTAARRKRSVESIDGSQMALPQSVLVVILNSQPVKDKFVLIVTSEFGSKVTIDGNSTVVVVPVQSSTTSNNNNNNNNNNKTEEKKTPGWIIPVAIIGAVLGLLIIVLIVLVVTKKGNKVDDTA